MMTRIFAATGIATILAFGPALAQDMKCDDATLVKLEADTAAITDAAKKEATMEHVKLAKESLVNKDDKACQEHLKEAIEAMKK
jgi:biotin synthase-related radical SAM superfamily protein